MSERVRSHACTRIAKLLSGHTKLERDLAADLLDARTRAKELEGALRAYGVHGATCQRRQHWAGDPAYCPCTCGFERALRGENRPLDVSGPNGGENSPLERGEEKG